MSLNSLGTVSGGPGLQRELLLGVALCDEALADETKGDRSC